MITTRLNLLMDAYRIAREQVGEANRGKALPGICLRRCHKLRQIIWPEIRRVRWLLRLISARRARKQENAMNQATDQTNLFNDQPVLSTDMYVLLQLFTNHFGVDRPKDFYGLHHVYHSVHTHPDKLPKSSWSEAGVWRAIKACEQAGLIAYGEKGADHKWTITQRGIEARRAADQIARPRKRKTA